MAELVQELTGCTILEAQEALAKHNGSVVDAVEGLIVFPTVKGILPKPKINTGLTPEQEEMCRRGRELQDKVNAVFSVAHSQTQRASSLSHEEPVEPIAVSESTKPAEVLTLKNE
jgi:hypothetical protein